MSLRAVGVSVAGGVSALDVEDSSIANKLITTRIVVKFLRADIGPPAR
jgi:hypothetical protein